MKTHPAKLVTIIGEALAREPEERVAFLDQVCSGDEELRREVESLLTAHQKAEAKFLKVPAIEMAAQGIARGGEHSLIGQTFSHYNVISILGVGGMGEVYLARDTRLERKVALKFLPAEFTADANRLRRFEQEAKAASSLNHPNIVTIYEIGQAEGAHYIAAELIEGQTLRQTLAAGQLPISAALDIAIQTASSLSAAHEADITHRDIKPENTMIRPDGLVKVLEFRPRQTDRATGRQGDGATGRRRPHACTAA